MCQKLKYLLPMKLIVVVSWLVVSVNFFFFPRRVRAVLFSSVLLGWFFCSFCGGFCVLVLGFLFCFGLVFFNFRNTITRKSPHIVLLGTLAFWIESVVLSSVRTARSTVILHLCYLSNSTCSIRDVSAWANVSSCLRHPAGKMPPL